MKFIRIGFRIFLFGFFIFIGYLTLTQASESIFAFTYTTDVQPKGNWEYEHQSTARFKKEAGDYSVLDSREEIEYGISDNFQIALYLNHHYVYANKDVPAEDPNNPGHRLPGEYETGGEDVHHGHDPSRPYNSYHFSSVSTEFIWRLLSPYKDKFGLALYMEPEYGSQEAEIEWKLLLQKNWLEDRLIWAINSNYAVGYENEGGGEYERDSMIEFFTGLTYRFAPGFYAGGEFWNHHEYADASQHEHSAYFAGPTIHYGAKKWWATLGYLRQLPMGKAYSLDNKEFALHDHYIYGGEHEQNYVRFKIGFNFD